MNLNRLIDNKAKLNQFKKKGIENVWQLLNFLPKDYKDYSNPVLIEELGSLFLGYGEDGKIPSCNKPDVSLDLIIKSIRPSQKVTTIIASDNNNEDIRLTFFGNTYHLKDICPGMNVIVNGKAEPNQYGDERWAMINPVIHTDKSKGLVIMPIYSKIEGMADIYLKTQIERALDVVILDDFIPMDIASSYDLMNLKTAYRELHSPTSMKLVAKANERIDFNELYRFSLLNNNNNMALTEKSKRVINKSDKAKEFLKTLPFELTKDQLESVKNIFGEMEKQNKTLSLVQGDVGCGKTIVSILLMILVAENGYQSSLMAPTGVLAYQHYLEIKERTDGMDFINPVYLAADMKAKEKREALKGIASGEYNLIIGTHSIISEGVEFKNLALGIIDEEHRFGVMQRENLKAKGDNDTHLVSMSATPIPRSLAISVYGEGVSVYNIKTMPNGRKPVLTAIESEFSKAYNFLGRTVMNGYQGYVVCPLIEDSKSESFAGIKSVEATYDDLVKFFKNFPEIKIGKITGDMKKKEIDEEIDKFKNKEYDILVSTTIIEVGVNVPNATTIVIQNCERFGLAQLHQLRGRVGRGSVQSHCILVTDKVDTERLKVMTSTTDGFLIAKEDLRLRGIGDLLGTKQSGYTRAVTLMLENSELYSEISKLTHDLLSDPKNKRYYQPVIDDYDMATESDRSIVIE